MDIREPQSVLALFGASFAVTNKLFGRLIILFILFILGAVALAALAVLLHVPSLVVSLLGNVYSVFLSVVLIKAVAAQAEEEKNSLFDLIAASPLPTIFTIVLWLLAGLLGLAAGLVCAIATPLIATLVSPLIMLPFLVVFLLIACFLYVRLGFAPLAIALREQGPIHALIYSWQITRGHFFAVLFTLLLCAIFPAVCLLAIGYGFYVGIPLYFAESFDITHLTPPWIITFIATAIIYVFVSVSMFTYWVMVFLNLSYAKENTSSADTVSPHAFEKGASLPISSAAVFENATPQNVQVLKASVKTHENDEALSQHLDQVYQPQPETQFVQTEEDRMPTIIFDDEMAAQIAKDRARWEQEQNKKRSNQSEDNGPDTIKMSK